MERLRRFAGVRAEVQRMRGGDWLVVALGTFACVALFGQFWRGGAPDKAVVRAGGQVVAELALDAPRSVSVQGPLGETRVEVEPGRARVASDPGPRQYCVRQGWLTQANAVALCAPNQVSLSLTGRMAGYDSLSY